MFREFAGWRMLAVGTASLAIAACTAVPKQPAAPPPVAQPAPDVLPTDTARHRVALLVPTSGANAQVGQSIANAATMALLDTNATNLRVTTYDTATNPAEAARTAVKDGNRLILGPLLSSDIPASPMPSTHSAMSAGKVKRMWSRAIVEVSPALWSPG